MTDADDEKRPTKEECLRGFWRSVAYTFSTLPPEVQEEYARKYPRGSGRPDPNQA